MSTKINRDMVSAWVLEALRANGNQGSILEISRHVWMHHERDIRNAGDLLYTWQYDLRWAITDLNRRGSITHNRQGEPWRLANATY